MSAYTKSFEKLRVRPDPAADRAKDAPACQWDGCAAAGSFRAPVGRMREGEYFHFCLDHVRLYNKSFNYFSGVSNDDISRFQKEALTGHRPTWRMGTNASVSPEFSQARSGSAGYYRRMRDPFGLFSGKKVGEHEVRQRKLRTLEQKALETLGLDARATPKDIRNSYKALVKQHHPDANGGDRGSEDRFRAVLEAYRLLKQAGLC
jgi:curved DNA-binding protein CbpA